MSNLTTIAKSVPSDIKRLVKRNFNGEKHAEVYKVLEDYLGEKHCIYEDGHVYKVAQIIAGVA